MIWATSYTFPCLPLVGRFTSASVTPRLVCRCLSQNYPPQLLQQQHVCSSQGWRPRKKNTLHAGWTKIVSKPQGPGDGLKVVFLGWRLSAWIFFFRGGFLKVTCWFRFFHISQACLQFFWNASQHAICNVFGTYKLQYLWLLGMRKCNKRQFCLWFVSAFSMQRYVNWHLQSAMPAFIKVFRFPLFLGDGH